MLEFEIVIASFVGTLMALTTFLLPIMYFAKKKVPEYLKKLNPLKGGLDFDKD